MYFRIPPNALRFVTQGQRYWGPNDGTDNPPLLPETLSALAGAGASSGVATASAHGIAVTIAAGSAAGVGAASANAVSRDAAQGAAAGTATASAGGVAVKVGAGLAAGAATAVSHPGVFGRTAGAATAVATGGFITSSTFSASGVATAAAVGIHSHVGAFSASGAATASAGGVGNIRGGHGRAAGVGAALGAGIKRVYARGVSTGLGRARAISATPITVLFIESPRFPDYIAEGATGGPTFLTEVFETHIGTEQRRCVRTRARHKFDASYGVREKADMDDVRTFFAMAHGRRYGFRFKDWNDYQIISGALGTGDGVTTAFDINKVYTVGAYSYIRRITKPVADTVVILADGVTVTPSAYTVNSTRGIITFTVAPTLDAVLTLSCEFDVPVRFDSDVLSAVHEGYSAESMSSISLLEVLHKPSDFVG